MHFISRSQAKLQLLFLEENLIYCLFQVVLDLCCRVAFL